ncbi:MAG: hypothetical protein AAF316_00325 [Cyanobacteria bacterium P01_A01_bin.80]
MKPVIVTHASDIKENGEIVYCPDAMASIWAILHNQEWDVKDVEIVWQKFLHVDAYQKFSIPFEYEERQVIFVDFSYPLHVMEQIARKSNLTVLDHHESRENIFPALKLHYPHNVTAVYSPKEEDCGATLAWKFYSNGKALPWFLKHVWYRDCGVNGYYEGEIPESEAFNNWLSRQREGKSIEDQMKIYDYLLDAITEGDFTYKALIKEGMPLLIERDEICQREANIWEKFPVTLNIDFSEKVDVNGEEVIRNHNYNVPFIQIKNQEADKYCSIIGRYLKHYSEYPFVCISTTTGLKSISLRKHKNSNVNLADIAKYHGGGGHSSAAGFEIKI